MMVTAVHQVTADGASWKEERKSPQSLQVTLAWLEVEPLQRPGRKEMHSCTPCLQSSLDLGFAVEPHKTSVNAIPLPGQGHPY